VAAFVIDECHMYKGWDTNVWELARLCLTRNRSYAGTAVTLLSATPIDRSPDSITSFAKAIDETVKMFHGVPEDKKTYFESIINNLKGQHTSLIRNAQQQGRTRIDYEASRQAYLARFSAFLRVFSLRRDNNSLFGTHSVSSVGELEPFNISTQVPEQFVAATTALADKVSSLAQETLKQQIARWAASNRTTPKPTLQDVIAQSRTQPKGAFFDLMTCASFPARIDLLDVGGMDFRATSVPDDFNLTFRCSLDDVTKDESNPY
jgi:hypothetical protein